MKGNLIIGYSGHAYVVCDIFKSTNQIITGYFEKEEKITNPFKLKYLGSEQSDESLPLLESKNWFVAIGNNRLRQIIIERLISKGMLNPISIQHKEAIVAKHVEIGFGTMVAAGSIINPMTRIGNGVICNTGSIIEIGCTIEDFVHIAPGAILSNNVVVGKRSFIGANTVVKEGVIIGNEVRIGAGSVILKDIPDGVTVVGNPGRVVG